MWRNADVLDFVGWLRSHNDSLPERQPKAGFFGLDLYSMHASMEAVLTYLDKVDPEGAARARYRYACFENFGEDPQAYGYAAGFGFSHTCESEVVAQLVDMRRRAAEYARRDGWGAIEEFFSAEQNARLVRDAEQYYRTMFRGRISSWNLRDAHMVDTFDALVRHLQFRQSLRKSRRMGAQFAPRRRPRHTDGPRWRVECRPANTGKIPRRVLPYRLHHLHRNRDRSFQLGRPRRAQAGTPGAPRQLRRPLSPDRDFRLRPAAPRRSPVSHSLREPMLERAIGVIYLPESELTSHYFEARLSDQFDAIIHIDRTRAVEPLEPIALVKDHEPAETFPTGE